MSFSEVTLLKWLFKSGAWVVYDCASTAAPIEKQPAYLSFKLVAEAFIPPHVASSGTAPPAPALPPLVAPALAAPAAFVPPAPSAPPAAVPAAPAAFGPPAPPPTTGGAPASAFMPAAPGAPLAAPPALTTPALPPAPDGPAPLVPLPGAGEVWLLPQAQARSMTVDATSLLPMILPFVEARQVAIVHRCSLIPGRFSLQFSVGR